MDHRSLKFLYFSMGGEMQMSLFELFRIIGFSFFWWGIIFIFFSFLNIIFFFLSLFFIIIGIIITEKFKIEGKNIIKEFFSVFFDILLHPGR